MDNPVLKMIKCCILSSGKSVYKISEFLAHRELCAMNRLQSSILKSKREKKMTLEEFLGKKYQFAPFSYPYVAREPITAKRHFFHPCLRQP